MINLDTRPRPTTSRYFDEDARLGEVTLIGVVSLPTGIWILAEVLNPDSLRDLFRAYPDSDYANRVGLICASANSREHAIEHAKQWS